MRILRILVMFVAVALLPAAAHAGTRVALVVGNGTYAAAGQLANPVNDARIVGQSLQQAGFEIVPLSNASMAQFRAALSSFRLKAQGAEIAMVYFAGHGIEAKGRNWLLPVDARLASEFDLSFEAIELDQVMESLQGASMRIVVLDACRNNPFGQAWKSGSRSVSRGLGRVDADDVMVLFAAAPGTTASDGDGANSPFARSLAQRLLQPGLPVQMLGGVVRDDVLRATGGEQKPYVSSSVTGTPVYLIPGAAAPALPAPMPMPARIPQPVPASRPALAMPATRPQTGIGAAALIRECDRLAGVEGDPDRPAGAPFVAWDSLLPVLAIPACTKAVEAAPGEARMLVNLSQAQAKGNNAAQARGLLEQAATAGSGEAMKELGNLYRQGIWGVTQDYAQARSWYEQAAAKGSAGAMNSIGFLYQQGNGVTQDYAQARSWYEQAAAKGSTEAMNSIGFLYQQGNGVAQDYAQARSWYEQAAAKGNASAMYDLGTLYDDGKGVVQDYAQARSWYEQAAAKGQADAMNNLGFLYQHSHGVTQDYAQARSWYEQAAAKGSTDAMNSIGFLYQQGNGVTQDYAQARSWYEQAAAKGNASAMYDLGTLYDDGKGVVQDYAQARSWYEQAAAKGNADAMINLGNLYYNGHGVTQDYAQARSWFEQSAAKGQAGAMNWLGFLYANGKGVTQDMAQARTWYQQAAAKGHDDAKQWLAQHPQ